MDTNEYVNKLVDIIRGKIELVLEEEDIHPSCRINMDSIFTELEMNLNDNMILTEEEPYHLDLVILD